ncbi:hypothetical protein Hrubri_1408 [Herbaspirillum rubrisubalbicans M1]|uniref:hypothetical protein n=1 Tax=Herbaspirillum rubrisubalbicans TaxID=80842 RepID=UPI00073A1C30|nr:hypothetical protein [Herbaspirillum rubrisubalbicans]ALU88617.1 hypothetical protein Hrubri_1408 [Herbaspirillum rubrisubalbicans M1]
MTPITCYQTDDNGIFTHQVDAYPFPLGEELNVPYMAVQIAPPEVPDGHRARWVSPFQPMDPEYDTAGQWIIEEVPPPAPTEEPEAPDVDALAQA